jgi:radical SAM superfamily enzyme YgiQ (UPF0313 family)
MRENLGLAFIRHPAVDVVMLGEADLSTPRFFQKWEAERNPLPRIPGVLVKHGGQIVDGGEPEQVEDLDTLPFLDFSGFNLEDYSHNKIYLSTSRGCVRQCSFCTHIIQHKVFRTMSPQRTVAEIKHHLQDRPNGCLVEFNDSLINGDVRRVAEIADLLIDYRSERLLTHPGSDFGWSGMAILHPTLTLAMLRKMRWGGCRRLHFGLESGSQKMIDLMRKNFRLSDAVEIIKNAHKAGIGAHLFLLVGFPGETESDFQMTLDFVERHAPYLFGASVSFCEIQKASHLDRHAADYDVRLPVEDPTRWVSRDGSNNYDVRIERTRRAMDLIAKLGLSTCIHTSKIGEFIRVPEPA